jgi:anti-sigma regulatory factor (Ser/Thr protein kinase)
METLLGINRAQIALHVGESGEAAAARRQAAVLAQQAGFNDTRAGMLALIVTEAATNIEKHAGEGSLLLQRVSDGERLGVEVLALDRGPGMGDLAHSLLDGSSSVGTYGVGLGTMRRQADEFDVYSRPGKGTVLRMVVWDTPPVAGQRGLPLQVGAVCVPYPGEEACGDTWALRFDSRSASIMVCDGLGHGTGAADASSEASRVLATHALPPGAMLHALHGAMRSTRGAAVAVAELDLEQGQVHFAGVGNISACVVTGEKRYQLVSHNGIVGANMTKVQTFSADWARTSTFIAHSDGLTSRWQLSDYPGLEHAHAGVMAAVLYRDHARGRDDATVLVVKEAAQ